MINYPGDRRVAASFSFDVDAESAVLFGAPQNAQRMSLMSHQAYGPLTGVPRILDILERHRVTATFFVPGVTALRYPETVKAIVGAGHEIGVHGYLHEELPSLSPAERKDTLLRSIGVIERASGQRPTAHRAPMWEMTWDYPELLAQEGFLYDSSLMDSDHPYELATSEGSLVELPLHWGLDDWEQYCYLPGVSGTGYIAEPDVAARLWRSELEGMRAFGGLWILTNHPFLSGRPGRSLALDRLIGEVTAMEDVWTASLGQIAQHVRSLGLTPRKVSEFEG